MAIKSIVIIMAALVGYSIYRTDYIEPVQKEAMVFPVALPEEEMTHEELVQRWGNRSRHEDNCECGEVTVLIFDRWGIQNNSTESLWDRVIVETE